MTEPIQQAVISAVVPGRIATIDKGEGSYVKKGEVIITLEKEKEELTVDLKKLLSESKAELNGAKVKMETLKKDYEATKHLFDKSSSVSEEQLWEKELNYKQASAEYKRLQLREKKEVVEKKLADVNLRQHIIRAPFNCFVTKHHKNLSESCKAQEPLVRVVNVNRCRFVTYVDVTKPIILRRGAL
ncbi:MAG: efflux RND transporter periplasmic adaptor subunit [Chitinivibrionales bacterium]